MSLPNALAAVSLSRRRVGRECGTSGAASVLHRQLLIDLFCIFMLLFQYCMSTGSNFSAYLLFFYTVVFLHNVVLCTMLLFCTMFVSVQCCFLHNWLVSVVFFFCTMCFLYCVVCAPCCFYRLSKKKKKVKNL